MLRVLAKASSHGKATRVASLAWAPSPESNQPPKLSLRKNKLYKEGDLPKRKYKGKGKKNNFVEQRSYLLFRHKGTKDFWDNPETISSTLKRGMILKASLPSDGGHRIPTMSRGARATRKSRTIRGVGAPWCEQMALMVTPERHAAAQ